MSTTTHGTQDMLIVGVHPRADQARICLFQLPGQPLAAVKVSPGLNLGTAIRERIRYGFGANLDETSLLIRGPHHRVPDGEACPALSEHNQFCCPVCGVRA
jgi:hypothetical protein